MTKRDWIIVTGYIAVFVVVMNIAQTIIGGAI